MVGPAGSGTYFTTGFRPTNVAGMAVWYEADDPLNGGALPADGASLTTWKDKSSNGRDLTMGSATFRTTAWGGKPTVDMQTGGHSNAITLSQPQPLTVFVMAQATGTVTGQNGLFDGGASNQLEIMITNAPDWHLYAGTHLASGMTTVQQTSHALYVGVFNTTSSVMRLNGSQVQSGNAGSGNLTGLEIGSANGGSPSNCQFAAFLLYSGVLPTPTIQTIENYLLGKWS